jgi:hypothetical protein
VVPVINDIGRYFVNCTLFDFVSVVDDFKVTIKIRRLENMIRKLWFIENMIRKVRGKVGTKEKSLGTRLGISLWNFRAFVKEFLPAEWTLQDGRRRSWWVSNCKMKNIYFHVFLTRNVFLSGLMMMLSNMMMSQTALFVVRAEHIPRAFFIYFQLKCAHFWSKSAQCVKKCTPFFHGTCAHNFQRLNSVSFFKFQENFDLKIP